jgi:hypothetical protein
MMTADVLKANWLLNISSTERLRSMLMINTINARGTMYELTSANPNKHARGGVS